jgi:hypothetical protein
MDLLNFKGGTQALEAAAQRLLDERIEPMMARSIDKLSEEVQTVIVQASGEIDRNIAQLSREIHDHRSITKEEIAHLIDYAAQSFGSAIDERMKTVKQEASALINEKVQLLKEELEDAAVRSRRSMYTNAAISLSAAVCMAGVGLVYKKVSLGELDLLTIFRVALLSCATFSFVLAGLKGVQRWRGMRQVKKGMATVAIGYLGVLRPNGALGLLLLSAALLAGWVGLHYYAGG